MWLWCRLAGAPPIGPLAWEPPYAMGVALKREREQKEAQTEYLSTVYMMHQKKKKDYRAFEILLRKSLEEMQNQMEIIVKNSWRK